MEKELFLANKNLPNCISAVRILGTASLLFIEPLSDPFLIVYTLSGITDVLDGFIARKMKTTSELGAKLDSIADLLFYAVMLIRIFPVMWEVLPKKIWIAVGTMIVIRLFSYGTAAKKYHRFASQHTYLNKASGLSVFFVPYAITGAAAAPYCWTVCAVAMTATIEEFIIHLTSAEYNPARKTLLLKPKAETQMKKAAGEDN